MIFIYVSGVIFATFSAFLCISLCSICFVCVGVLRPSQQLGHVEPVYAQFVHNCVL